MRIFFVLFNAAIVWLTRDASQLDSMQDEASKNNKEIAEDKLLEQKKNLA